MRFKPGDHICAMYSTRTELAGVVSGFLAEGLRRRERCWYVASGDETPAVDAALRNLGIDVDAEASRGALNFVSAGAAYVVHGGFDPEATMSVFNDAIEQAYTDGFSGFRAAADMSWAMGRREGPDQLIMYEALLKSLFANCKAIGMCLYDRGRVPLQVINGALVTHPIAGSSARLRRNPFYHATIDRLLKIEDADVVAKLERLNRLEE